MPLESMYPTPARFKRIFFLPSSSSRRMALRSDMLPSPIVMRPSMSRTVTSPAWRSRILSSAIWDSPPEYSLKFLLHSQCRAAFRPHEPFDIVHEVTDQKNPSPRSLHDVGWISRIGHACRIKAVTLIGYFDLQRAGRTAKAYGDFFRFVFLVSMHDRVRDSFADGNINSKSGVFSGAALLNKIRGGGRGLSNCLNVAGQNESRRLFGHRRRGLSRREIAVAAELKHELTGRRTFSMRAGRLSRSCAPADCVLV